MPTWAKRGIQTALVTGGLLMLGTSIASASENVNPDQPPSPLDGGLDAPLHTVDDAVGDTPKTTHDDVVTGRLADVDHAIGAADTSATRTGGDVTRSSEWGALSGDLLDPSPSTAVHDPTLFRVPLDVLGRAVVHHPPAPATEDETQFGPADTADSLLGVNQVPVLGDLFSVPNLRTARPDAPMSTLDQTQVFPAIGQFGVPGASTLDATQLMPAIAPAEITQRLPVVSDGPALPVQRVQSHPGIRPVTPGQARYQPMAGSLPPPAVPGLPTLPVGAPPVAASLPTLNKPPIPTLPVLGGPSLRSAPSVQSAPSAQSAPALPSLPALPTGAPPVSANLPVVSGPSVPNLPTASVPSLPTASVPSLPAASVPSLPTASAASLPAASVPSLPAASVPSVPPVPSIPAVPSVPGVPPVAANLPGLGSPSLPVPQSAPATPSFPLPDLPPVPTLPAMPAMPHLPAPTVHGPSVPEAPQELPAGSAQQLMAQLRNLISDLENSASGGPTQLHPLQEPPAL